MTEAMRNIDGDLNLRRNGFCDALQELVYLLGSIAARNLDKVHAVPVAKSPLENGPALVFRLRRTQSQDAMRPRGLRQQLEQSNGRELGLGCEIT